MKDHVCSEIFGAEISAVSKQISKSSWSDISSTNYFLIKRPQTEAFYVKEI